ncbi:MAG TPA: hypothetical protein VHD85_00565 [Terracidiphilus sp.]|nr:hypothetical protein [Terracidiphilus sp.]
MARRFPTQKIVLRLLLVPVARPLLAYQRSKSDSKLANRLFSLELTERLSANRLARWEAAGSVRMIVVDENTGRMRSVTLPGAALSASQ